MKPFPFPVLMILLGLLCAGLLMASLLIGPAGLGIADSLAALFAFPTMHPGTMIPTAGAQHDTGAAIALVMREIRLPRAILGAALGAALGLAGAMMQGLLRNPLAEPGLIGTSASAALGAVLAIQTGVSATFALALPLAGLAGAMVSVVLMLALAGPRATTLVLILAGVAISALATALMALVLNLSPNPFAANEVIFWMMGSLADRSMPQLWLAAPFLGLGAILAVPVARQLDALSLGEDVAATMGVNLTRLRILTVASCALLVGTATATAGAIGFVGLVVPHLLRRAVGARPGRVIAASVLGGAAMVLAADIAVRVIAPDRDLKLGVLTALVGTPFFLRMILDTRRRAL